MEKVLSSLNHPVLVVDKGVSNFYPSEGFVKTFSERERKCIIKFLKEKLLSKSPLKSITTSKGKYSLEVLGGKEGFLIVFEPLPSGLKGLKEVFDVIPCFVLILRKDEVVYLNPYAQDILGYNPKEVVNKNIDSILGAVEDKIEISKIYNNGESLKKEKVITFLTKGGELKTILSSLFLIKKEGEDPLLVIAGVDISYLSGFKKRIEELYKEKDVFQFLRNLIHDFNNLLRILMDYIEKMERSLTSPEEVLKYLGLSKKALSSWMELNKAVLLTQAKREKRVLAETELINFLKENLELFQVVAGPDVLIQYDFDYISAVWVPGDEFLWRYIFLNFISNSRDAIKGKGNIEIAIRLLKDPELQLLLEVRDDGEGIPEELLEEVFKPFFSTKKSSTGLGLYLVKKHIESLGGCVQLSSKLGKGTTFRLRIPVVRVKRFPFTKNEGKVILVVEDDEFIREGIVNILKEKGFEVHAFSSYSELTEKIKNLKRVHLLISDYHLPELEGHELYRELKKLFPELEALFLTGDIFGLKDIPSHRVLLKPFTIESLLKKVEELL